MPLQKRPVTGLADPNQQRRDRETLNQVLDHSFDDSKVQQSAEKIAGITPVNPAYGVRPEIVIERYGAEIGLDSSSGAMNDKALQDAVAVINTVFTQGGTIRFSQGYYLFDSLINLNALRGITLQGVGGLSGGAAPGTVFVYTGTASEFIDLRGSLGCFIKDIDIQHNNAGFTGTYVLWGNNGSQDSFRGGAMRCNFGTSVGTGVTHIDLDGAIEISFDHCHFHYGDPSIVGMSAGSYSNVITFKDCVWRTSHSIPVERPGEAWAFYNCTWQQLNSGIAGAINCGSTSTRCRGLSVVGGWLGDVTDPGGTWFSFIGYGITVQGCRINGGGEASTFAFNLVSCEGVKIEGNEIGDFTAAVNFGDANNKAVSFTNNYLSNLTNTFSNSANAPADIDFDFTPNSPQVNAEPGVASGTVFNASWTASTVNPTLGNGILSTRYTKRSRLVTYSGILQIGSTTANGTGNYFISAPFVPATALIQTGSCYLLDSGTGFQVGTVRTLTDGTARIQFIFHGAGNVMGAATPVVPANGDELHWTISYLT